MIQTKSYKLIYLILICGLICSFFGTNIPETVAATSSKQLLTQADFKYLGAFELPSSVPSGADTGWGRGLAIRSVNGELRAFSAAWTASGPQSVYEVRVPATFSGTPTASLVKEWGDITHGKMVAANGNPKIVGLYWDQTDQRLYWSYQDGYNASGGSDPSLGYSTLSDSGSSTAYGPWYFPSTGPKATGGCVVPVPDWFASSYASGRRLAAVALGRRRLSVPPNSALLCRHSIHRPCRAPRFRPLPLWVILFPQRFTVPLTAPTAILTTPCRVVMTGSAGSPKTASATGLTATGFGKAARGLICPTNTASFSSRRWSAAASIIKVPQFMVLGVFTNGWSMIRLI